VRTIHKGSNNLFIKIFFCEKLFLLRATLLYNVLKHFKITLLPPMGSFLRVFGQYIRTKNISNLSQNTITSLPPYQSNEAYVFEQKLFWRAPFSKQNSKLPPTFSTKGRTIKKTSFFQQEETSLGLGVTKQPLPRILSLRFNNLDTCLDTVIFG
jgi:hypothetical protein